MDRHLDAELGRIRQEILRMGGEAEAMLERVMKALLNRDSEEALAVHRADDRVDELEVEIDGSIWAIMARQQPTAVDLRFLIAATRIIHEIERVGDTAKNIAKSVIRLTDEPDLKPYIDLPRMSQLARKMVRESLDAFTRGDSELARAVIETDPELDQLYEQIYRELLTFMLEDPRAVTRGLEILTIARYLERAADHAVNMAEDVVFLVEAEDIRHVRQERAESDEVE